MNNKQGYARSLVDCLKIVDYYSKKGIETSMSSKEDDMVHKFDIIIGGVKIDVKRLNALYCDVGSLSSGDNLADRIWIILDNDLHHSYSIKKEALKRICLSNFGVDKADPDGPLVPNPNRNPNVRYEVGPHSKNLLAYFSLDMLDADDYKTIDVSGVLV